MTFEQFFEYLGDIDWLAVIVATIAATVIGILWFGPIFGKVWAKGGGTAVDFKNPDWGKTAKGLITTVLMVTGPLQTVPRCV
ncbi:MAG TPA: DUF1761 domain-containing protein [Vicinamibacterales bacterium]|nr:DUF1761 domain-containing protein [Vicinamibacterales bacterium]